MKVKNRTPLSDHFYQYEIFPDGPEPDQFELFLARSLVRNACEPLREIAGDPLSVRDGRRLWFTHEAYEVKDYHPSKTSDHAFGAGFLIETDSGGARKFPGVWFFGVGAGDVKPVHRGVRRKWTPDEFEEAKERLLDPLCRMAIRTVETGHSLNCTCKVGQLIYYRKRGHIHVSNNRRLVLSSVAIGGLDLPPKRGPAYVNPS